MNPMKYLMFVVTLCFCIPLKAQNYISLLKEG